MTRPRHRRQLLRPPPVLPWRPSGRFANDPAGRRALWGFIKLAFGIALPTRRFSEGNSAPFDFVADAYFNPRQDLAAWACRSGLKTLSASIIAALEFLHTDGLQARVLSGSSAQAGVLYEYWARWCRTVLERRLPIVMRDRTLIAGGRMEIVAASQAAIRGPKVHHLFQDEVDETDPSLHTAAVGMVASSPTIPGRTVYTSTWHRSNGLMARLIESAAASAIRLHRWDIWESIARCPFERHEDGAGCRSCPLAGVCLAKAREVHNDLDWRTGIAAECGGLYAVDDVIKAYGKLDLATWQSEYECRRPRVQGLVYADFDPLRHRRPAPPADLRIYRSIDWGLSQFVCLWLGQDSQGRVWVLDTYQAQGGTLAQHARTILQHPLKKVEATYCDPAGRNRNDQTGKSNVEIFRELGIPCTFTTSAWAREVRNGIALVRSALSPASGEPTLFYVNAPGNRAFEQAMTGYANRRVNGVFIDEPHDPQEHEHIPDALRYFFVNRKRHDATVGLVTLRTS